MAISALDLFKVGIGPSSSHTMGPMGAAGIFVDELVAAGALASVARVRVDLFGSVAATGIGHGADRAVVGGLLGHRPDEVDPDVYAAAVGAVSASGTLMLGGTREVPFGWAADLRFHREAKPRHPNALELTAFGADGVVVHANCYYSVGGGFVVDERQAEAGKTGTDGVVAKYPFNTARELLATCAREGLSMAQVMGNNEDAWRPEAETRAHLLRVPR